MTDAAPPVPANAISTLARKLVGLMTHIPYGFVALVVRISIAGVFWQSGQTKVDNWHIADSAIELFRSEYRLPLIDPVVAAYLAAFAEYLFPILLVVGLATRFAALALLAMTVVIEVFVYPEAWPTHGTWAACFLVLMANGPGPISLDHLVEQRFGRG